MPLPMVHLEIAKNLHDAGLKLGRLPQYFLGSISPDAIHMRQNSDQTAKNQTHLISAGKKRKEIDEFEYFDFLLKFIRQNQYKADTDFLCGYCLHIYTDLIWVKKIYYDFVDKYEKDMSPIQDERRAYYNDTGIIDQLLFNESGRRKDIWRELQIAKGADFLDLLSAVEIDSWNERTLHWYDSGESQHKNPVKYITKSDILRFIDECSEQILYNIKLCPI